MDLDGFASSLARYGVAVPGWDTFQALRYVTTSEPTPPRPILDLTADELRVYTERHALYAIMRNPRIGKLANHSRRVQDELSAAFQTRLAGHVDALIVGLRPAFDEAADAARDLVAAGVKPADGVVELFDAPDTVRAAWRRFCDVHAATLDNILEVRRFMGKHLGAPPATVSFLGRRLADDQIPWEVTISRPTATGSGVPALPTPTYGAPQARWLARAKSLYLPTSDELNPGDELKGTGLNVEGLLREARRRDAAGLSIPETDDAPTASIDLSGAYFAKFGATTNPEEEPAA